MFWNSVKESLDMFLYWETYLAGLEYFAIYFIPLILLGQLMERKNARFDMAVGFSYMFVMPFIQIAATVIFILTLSPIILGLSDDAAWSYPWKLVIVDPLAFIILILLILVVYIILSSVPILGRLNSLYVLIVGATTLMVAVAPLEQSYPSLVSDQITFIPGFWFIIGLLFFGGIMSWLGIIAFSFISAIISSASESLGELFMLPIVAVFGFIPVFIYGAWLGTQIKGNV